MLGGLEALGSPELRRRWERAQQMLEENGVTYNVYGDPRGIDRPWQLNAVPLLIASEEWPHIERAVVQRAALLSELLDDLYGRQRSVAEGWIPAELVHGHPGFLRPCHGTISRGKGLVVYGADLARSPDGTWHVIADRAQAPSGAGYALENRVVVARTMPELFGVQHVRRLAPFFQALREALLGLAADLTPNPQVVVLTPGPFNETYFEQAYLARYLGFPLVEGADLTARDEHVYLKTLSGLRPVHVILRRQDDSFCDPLELYRDSRLGVAGLLQAVRAGNVMVANALGSGLLETAALMPFLPTLARELLGEDLLMPSVPTWWCGDEKARSYALGHLHEVVIKPTFPGPARGVVFGPNLDAEARALLGRRIAAGPEGYVVQQQVELSTAPTQIGGDPDPRHVVVRMFAVSSGDGWTVMPGGLTRFSATRDDLVVSSQAGGGSKDTLVLSDEPVPFTSLLGRVERPTDVSRDGYALTSRVADNLYWVGRMSERLEAGVRLIRTALRGLAEGSVDAPSHPDAEEILELVDRMGRLGSDAPPSREQGWDSNSRDAPEEQLLRSMFAVGAGGLRHDASELHRLAWLVRDRISADAWRILLSIDQELVERSDPPALRVAPTLALLDEIVTMLSAFIGLVMDSTTRGLGWRFLDLGRRLERGLQTAALVRAGLAVEIREGSRRLQRILETADCVITYRSRYHTAVQLPLVVDLLLLDEANPRSVTFQMAQIATHLRELDKVPADACFTLLANLRDTEVDDLVELRATDWGTTHRSRMLVLLSDIDGALSGLSDSLNHAYLSHALPGRQPDAVWGRAL